MKLDWKTTLCLSGLTLFFVPLAQAQLCTVTNASLSGPYGYVASQAGTVPATTTTTGTGTSGTTTTGASTTSSYSNTTLLSKTLADPPVPVSRPVR